MRLSLAAGVLLALAIPLPAQDEAVSQAIAAFQGGDLASAEQILQAELQSHPRDAVALEVMAAVLDQEKKYAEAGEIYSRALAAAPASPSLLNNYGNHLLSTGRPQEAQAAFLKVLSLQPQHPNAGVQLARLTLDQHQPAEAAHYLQHLPSQIQDRPDVLLLRIRADYALHRNVEADALLARASAAVNNDVQAASALGEALSAAGKYDQAQTAFARALELQPENFQTLYNLGLAAAHAGHNERAGEVLEQALNKQPENVDVLYDLAAVDLNLNRGEASLALLAQAVKQAPQRADVQLLLARAAAQLGYFGDAVQAWESYLKLKPDDDVAKREHAFAEMALPVNADAALADLRAYTKKHPDDPAGHYEFGAAAAPVDPDQALPELTRALALKPHFAAAHLVRGMLLYRQGKLQLSVSDFEKAAKEDPNNAAILEHLGQNYLALERSADALRVLRQADEIDPRNPGVLLQLGRALAKAGQVDESSKVFAQYRALGPAPQGVAHPAGLVDFLSLSPTEQMARYRAGVERTLEKNPDNVDAQVRYLGLLLMNGKFPDAESTARKISSLQPDARVLAEAVQLLLSAQQYAVAKEMLQQAAHRGITSPELHLDLAISLDHIDGPQAALEALNRIGESSRTGDYYLARAQFLTEAKSPVEAGQALSAAFRAGSKRSDLYQSAALLLLHRDRARQALDVLEKGIQANPRDSQLRVLKAVALAIAGSDPAIEFQSIENRWPESSAAWVAHAAVLGLSGNRVEAGRALATGKALGAAGAAVDFCAALADRNASVPPAERRERLLEALPVLFGR